MASYSSRLLLLTALGTGIAAAAAVVACNSDDSNSFGEGASTPDAAASGDATTNSGDDAGASSDDAGAITPIDAASDAGTTTIPDAAPDAAHACSDDDGGMTICPGVLDGGDAPNDCITADSCAALAANLKPKVYASVVDCLGALATCEPSDQAAIDCVDTALAAACTDGTTSAACMQVATAQSGCTDPGNGDAGSLSDCESLLAGFTSAGRGQFVDCIQDSCGDGTLVPDCVASVLGLTSQ